MSSRMSSMLNALHQDVISPRRQPQWDIARAFHPVLKRHKTVESLLKAMHSKQTAILRYRDILARALIAQKKIHRGSFWSSLLMVAYEPMLKRLRGRVVCSVVSGNDVDQLVITSFMAAVDEFPLRRRAKHTSLHLRRATERKVFSFLRKRQGADAAEINLKTNCEFSTGNDHDPFIRLTDPSSLSIDELTDWIYRNMRGELSEEAIDLVMLPFIEERSLRHYVKRINPELSEEEQERVYQRVKRQRSRALTKVKQRLGHFMCPQNENEDAFNE